MKLTPIEVEQSTKSIVVPGLIFEQFNTESRNIGELHAEEYPSPVSVFRKKGLNFYGLSADWVLPSGLDEQNFTTVGKALSAAAEYLNPEALAGYKFQEKKVNEPKVEPPKIIKTVVTEKSGAQMEEIFFSDGSVSVGYTCPDKWEGQILLRRQPKELPYQLVEGPASLRGVWSNPPLLLNFLIKARKVDLSD